MRKQWSFCHFRTICFPKWFQVNWSLVLSILFSNLFCVRFAGTFKWPSRWEALLHSRNVVSLPPQRWLQTARVQISRKHFLPLKRFFFLPGISFFLRRRRRKCLPCSSEGGGELGKGELGGEEGRKAQTALLTTQVEGAEFAPFSRQKIRGKSILIFILLIIGHR